MNITTLTFRDFHGSYHDKVINLSQQNYTIKTLKIYIDLSK